MKTATARADSAAASTSLSKSEDAGSSPARPAIFPPPPGEHADDELTGAALTAVMDRYFATVEEDLKAASAPATLQFHQVKDIEVRKVSGWVLVTVKFRAKKSAPNEVTFRVRRSWAGVLRDRLGRVLGE